MSDRQARLVWRGVACEMWDTGDGDGFYVDFNPCPADTGVPETMAFPADPRRNVVKDWIEVGVWYEDATGGKAIRELGYEPVEDGGNDGTD